MAGQLLFCRVLLPAGLLCSVNILSFLRCITRPYEWGTQWYSNSLVKVCKSNLLTITPPDAPKRLLTVNWITMTKKSGKHFCTTYGTDFISHHQPCKLWPPPHTHTNTEGRTSDLRMQFLNSIIEPPIHIARILV